MLNQRALEVLRNPKLRGLFWTLVDQGVVSAGGFVVQVALARQLPAVEYGVFALVFGGLVALGFCITTLLYYPMAVRVSSAGEAWRRSLLGGSLILVFMLSVALSVVLATALAAFGRFDLILPTLAFFLAWQLQEGLRRALFGTLWHAAAIAGDAVTYGGNVLIVLGLARSGSLSIESALYGMAISAALGAILHARHLALALPTRSQLSSILNDFWSVAGPSSLGNGLFYISPQMILPWALAALSGPAAVAGFQAATNIINLFNPLFMGLSNIVPQAAARASTQGNTRAWQTVRGYALIATPPIVLYSIAILVAPEEILRLFYGTASDYVHLALVVRLLILSCVAGFAADTVILFLLGITSVRRATAINMAGAAACALVAFPLISLGGLAGGSATLLLRNLVRLALARPALVRSLP
jgi:O-antigen/teichoic acid export membrane protein